MSAAFDYRNDMLPEDATPDAKAWLKIVNAYRKPNLTRSTFELAITLVPFVLFWLGAWASFEFSFWPGLILVVPAAAFLLRLFIIQHDCGHGAFFARRSIDDWTGRLLGVLTFTPYDYWRRAHAEHHATAGNLEERGVGDITTLTVSEYRALPRWKKLGYRLYRNPLVLFGIGPIWVFLLKQRLPFGMMKDGALPWVSTMATNAGMVVMAALMIWRHPLVGPAGMAVPACGPARRLALRPALGPALADWPYRRAPRASPVEQDPLLPSAGSPARPSGTEDDQPNHADGKLRLRETRPLGRSPRPSRVLPRGAADGRGLISVR